MVAVNEIVDISNIKNEKITICDYERIKYFFKVSSDGLKATMYVDAKCNDNKLIRIAKLHIDFSDARELKLYILRDTKYKDKNKRIAWVEKYIVRFKYRRCLPNDKVRRIAVAAAAVAAFYSYTGFNATTKIQRPHRLRHKLIAAAAGYILMRAGYIKPYKVIRRRNKVKRIDTEAVTINGERIAFSIIAAPWNSKRNFMRNVLASSLMYLGKIASKINAY